MTYLEPSKESLFESIRRSIPSHVEHEEGSALESEGLTFADDGVMLAILVDRGAFMRTLVQRRAAKHRARAEFLKTASSEADLLKAGRIMMDPCLDPARSS
jgi:hypothetical protein